VAVAQRQAPVAGRVAQQIEQVSIACGSQENAGPLPSFLDPLGGPDAQRQVWGRSQGRKPGASAAQWRCFS